jgi:hypothetical protein
VVYAFNSFTRHELLRVHVLNVEWWPLGLLFLLRWVESRRFRDALGFALALTLQGLSGAYYLICSALLAVPWVLTACASPYRRPRPLELGRLAAVLLLCAAPAIVVLWPYVPQMRSMGFEKALVDGADLACYLQPTRGSALWGGLRLFGGCYGLPHFLGFAALGLMAGGLALLLRGRLGGRPRALATVAAVTAAIGLLLSAGPVLQLGSVRLLPGPFALLHAALPLVRGMDGSKRMGVLVILGGALLAGIAAARALARSSPARRPVLSLAAAAVLALEHWTPPRGNPVPSGAELPAVYEWLRGAGREPLVELPLLPEVSKRLWSSYMYFSTRHWRPLPIGRTSFYPPAHDFLAASLGGFPDESSVTLLARLGIGTVVVHPWAWEVEERAARLEALEADGRLRLVRSFEEPPNPRFSLLGLGGERVYRLEGQGGSGRPLCTPAAEIGRDAWFARSLAGGRAAPGEAARRPALRYEEWLERREWRTAWRADWATDGSRRTAWTTAGGQRPGDGLELRFVKPQAVAAVEISLGYPFDEFPRELVVVADRHGDEHQRLRWEDGTEWRWETLRSLMDAPREARLIVRVPRTEVLSLTLRIGGRDEGELRPRWTVPELRVFAECP